MAFFEKASQFISRLKKFVHERSVRAKSQKSEKADRGLVLSFKNKKFPSWSQFKYLREVLTAKEKIALEVFTVILAFSLVFLGVVWYLDRTETIADYGGEYTEGLIGAPQTINPILLSANDVDNDISFLVYAGLLKKDLKQEYISDLAEKFDISADQKTYTFRLRQNVRWHDGEPFGADDVIFTIKMIQEPAVRSPLRESWRNIRATKVDDETIQFLLPAPSSNFLSQATVGILPEHLWREIPISGFSLADLNIRPIGAGPYVFESFSRDRRGNIKSYNLIANSDYYSARPNIERLIFKFFSDHASAGLALNNRGIDAVSFLTGEERARIVRRDLNFYQLKLAEYNAVFFNTKKDLFQNKDLRAALALAIDRQKLAQDVFRGAVNPIASIFSETIFSPQKPLPAEERVRAGEILDALNWKMGEDGLRHRITLNKIKKKVGRKTVTEEEKKDEVLGFILTVVDYDKNLAAAEFVREAWTKIGVKAEIRVVSDNVFKKDLLRPRDFDALLYGEILGRDLDPFSFWHSSQAGEGGLNISAYVNRELDQLLEQARKSIDRDWRAEKYRAVDEILSRDNPAIALWAPIYYFAAARSVRGVNIAAMSEPRDRYLGIAEWYKQTRRVWK
ncbi:MAG: ABC transporter substrate-binding protein [Patescibacteria group bacterium]